ncbi:hypothetical protein RYA05_05005 [Pseudomonas syringae pv. actinidiae]|nr:hypothetical protein [Pseudomonas syringae pv. actinidiae]
MHYSEEELSSRISEDKQRGFVYSCITLYASTLFYANRLFSVNLLAQGERDAMELLTSKQQSKTVNQRNY